MVRTWENVGGIEGNRRKRNEGMRKDNTKDQEGHIGGRTESKKKYFDRGSPYGINENCDTGEIHFNPQI